MNYILINENGIEVKDATEPLSVKKMQRLVGVPGETALIQIVWYHRYSDITIKMIVDEDLLHNPAGCQPTCNTSEGDAMHGQVLVVSLDDQAKEGFGLLTPMQVEIVQKETDLAIYYALINENGVETIKAATIPTKEEIQLLVGVPGEEASTGIVDYHEYSDSRLKMIVDDYFERNIGCHPTCKTSEGDEIHGQVLVLSIDDKNKSCGSLLTPSQIEIVKRETTLLYGKYA